MNRTQEDFIRDMTPAQAEAVIAKFKGDPEIAADRSDAAYIAFSRAWELLNPTEYWQRQNRAKADGGVQYRLISL